MIFWDSSAVVSLFAEEERSAACRALRRSHRDIAIWTMTPIEVRSGLYRAYRQNEIDDAGLRAAIHRAERFFEAARVVETIEPVKEWALRLVAVHAISSADALQLGAALVLVDDRPRRQVFVTADDRLAEAATREGFTVVVPR